LSYDTSADWAADVGGKRPCPAGKVPVFSFACQYGLLRYRPKRVEAMITGDKVEVPEPLFRTYAAELKDYARPVP